MLHDSVVALFAVDCTAGTHIRGCQGCQGVSGVQKGLAL